MEHSIMIVILGAGLSGLSAAYHLKDDYEIFEMKEKVGGVASSVSHNGFVFDYGIHVLHTQNPVVLNLINGVLGDNIGVKNRIAWIYSHNTYTKYPFQANTFGLPVPIVKECVVEFIKAKYRNQAMEPENLSEWIYKMFGKGIAKHFLVPYSKKMWILDPTDLSIDWVNPRFPQPTIEEVVEGALHVQEKEYGVNAQFRYPIYGGIQAIADGLASKVKNVNLSWKAEKISLKKKKIIFSSGEEVIYDKLISTIPLNETIKMIDDNVPTTVKKAAINLKYVSDFIVNLELDIENLTDHHWCYFPEKKYPFLRINFPKNLSENTTPENKSSISAEVFYLGKRGSKKGELIQKVIDSLVNVGIITSENEIIHKNAIDIKYAYVLYTHDRTKNTEIIHKYLWGNDIFPAGRYGEWKYLWMDDAILSGKRIANDIQNNKNRR